MTIAEIEKRTKILKAKLILTRRDVPEILAFQTVDAMSSDEVDKFLIRSSEIDEYSKAAAFMAGHIIARLKKPVFHKSAIADRFFEEFSALPHLSEDLFSSALVKIEARHITKRYLDRVAFDRGESTQEYQS